MANLIGIVDRDQKRRKKYIASVKPELATFSWLEYGEREFGRTTIAWAAVPSAPISSSETPDGTSCFILGNLSKDGEPFINDAERLLQYYQKQGASGIFGQSGYYFSCLLDPSGEVLVGTDLLGLFPIYYYSTDTFLLFSTTPSLFRHFPKFTRELSPHGLAGILLTMHITGGRTIWRGVRRLSAGHMLHWQEGRGAEEKKNRMLEASSTYFGDSYQEHLETFHRLLRKTVHKETADRSISVLLSGGLDSRLLAGYLSETRKNDTTAVTFGDRTDYEMNCASRVAKTLKWPQVRIKVDFTSFPTFARKLVELEQLSNGFNDLAFFQGVESLQGTQPYIMTGFAGDVGMGGSHIRYGYDQERREHSFEAKFRKINTHGFSPSLVKTLVHPDVLGNSLEEVLEDLKGSYYSLKGLPFQRTWMFDMIHRMRFHTAASVAWRISFGAWPVMPYIDKEILEAAFGMPAASLLNRRAQIDLLCSHFPALAALPLDRNYEDTCPLMPSFYYKVTAWLAKSSDFAYKKHKVKQVLGISDSERRYYYRVFDINNPGWAAVRSEAEQFRAKAEIIFDRAILRELLPPPGVPIQLHDGIIEGSGRKTLLGFMLWAGRNL